MHKTCINNILQVSITLNKTSQAIMHFMDTMHVESDALFGT